MLFNIGRLELKIDMKPLGVVPISRLKPHNLVPPPCGSTGGGEECYLQDCIDNKSTQMCLQVASLVNSIQEGSRLWGAGTSRQYGRVIDTKPLAY